MTAMAATETTPATATAKTTVEADTAYTLPDERDLTDLTTTATKTPENAI